MKAILNGVKPWENDSWKANDKCKPCSEKQRDLEKKTMCYRSRFRPQDLLTTNDREAKKQLLGLTQRQCTLELQGSPLICIMSCLGNDPYPRIMLHKTKAHTLLVSHQKDNVIKDPTYWTQYERSWDHRHLVRRGHLRPRPRRRIPTPQSHPPRVLKGAPRLGAARHHPPAPRLKGGDAPSRMRRLGAQGGRTSCLQRFD